MLDNKEKDINTSKEQESDKQEVEQKIDENSPVTTAENETESQELDESKEDEDTPEVKLQKMEQEISELKDRLLRKQADFENFRKRVVREKEEAVRYANSMLLLDITQIIDDFERAIKSSEESKDFNSFHSGIELIEKQLTTMLEKKWGLKRFDSYGQEYDPDKHEAIMAENTANDKKMYVLEDFQKGYQLHDRILRPAKVKVGYRSDSAKHKQNKLKKLRKEGENNG